MVIYGPGGVGKTALAASSALSGLKPIFLDVGDSTGFQDVARVDGIDATSTWDDLRDALHCESLFQDFNCIVLDDLTKCEELASAWVVQNIPHEKGHRVSSIEGYGFGKGLSHVYDVFMLLLGDLDQHVRKGRWVVCIAHECTANVPNPSGEDFIRYEPRLQAPKSGKESIRHRVKEFCHHMFFVGFDIAVDSDGKASGVGTRTIYPVEMPTHWAKSRSLSEPIPYERGSNLLWEKLLKGETNV